MTGAMACLWQSVQALSAQALRNAVRNTASMAGSPDSLMGYGIPNMMNARLFLSVPTINAGKQETFSLSANPFTGTPVLVSHSILDNLVKVDILSITGQVIHSFNFDVNGSSTIRLDAFAALPSGLYFVRINNPSGQQVIRAVKL